MDSAAEDRLELSQICKRFLIPDHDDGPYKLALEEILTDENLRSGQLRLIIDAQDVNEFDQSLHTRLLADPVAVINAFETAVLAVIEAVFPEIWKNWSKKKHVNIGIEGELGPHTVSSRELTSALISKLVRVEAVVTSCSENSPKLVKSVHYCQKTGESITRDYRDALSNYGPPTSAVIPDCDDNGNALTMDQGGSKFIDQQTLTVQELPESAPVGQLPSSKKASTRPFAVRINLQGSTPCLIQCDRTCQLQIILEADLVNACKPGDRISVVGIYKIIAPRARGVVSGVMEAVVVANSVRPLFQDFQKVITGQDIRNARGIAHGPDPLSILANSLAPSLYGHDIIKKAIILLLLGGRERNLASGVHLRGDIHCLLIGDPGVAKSQLLRAVMHVTEHSVSTNGRGSSGVGLTAAVVTDSATGEKQLAPGAMVLADRGVVCIDEFDKMSDIERVAIHEVMEQQTVTIAKAGLQTQLNARCSVLAAGNPTYGNYDDSMTTHKNINLPDSLLSRFDLLFVMRDNMTSEMDRKIAEHVVGQAMYRAPGDDGRSVLTDAMERWALHFAKQSRIALALVMLARGGQPYQYLPCNHQ
ncbi:hypothetical protein ABBQ38_012414 [Trebouxia sp. C0009 RCD-2024]